ncbi:MAG: metalloregulator ArsR/SmtB family transcription factor [Endomicrobiaceae bacterium]|jgi:ArsR family transcriptional regulator|nr:metalloregulator ArsR/SmtB family transcription factor [Endomicrobiaceae bacterium]
MKIKNKFDINGYAEILKALGHPLRLKIVCGLSKKESCNVGTIAEKLSVPQPTVSQHLNILKSAGIIKGYRNGTQVCYKIENCEVLKIIESMNIDFCSEKLI